MKPAIVLPAARSPSPLIKTSRYAALIFGIMYGSMHFKSLQKKENLFREEEARLAPIRQKQIEEEKQRLNRAEMLYLAKETGTPVPSDF